MAWSDAARKAALETRRAHAKMKGDYKEKAKGFTKPIDFTYEYGAVNADRKQIAAELRKVRAGKLRYDNYSGGHAVVLKTQLYKAAASTGLRNYLRKGGARDRTFISSGSGAETAAYLRAQRLGQIPYGVGGLKRGR
jgi:hypothetical protein